MKPMIQTQGVERKFLSGRDTVYALKDVSIDIHPARLTILRGRSGSGKTTLMNLLGALDRPTAGQIWVEGREITQMAEHKRDEIRRKEIGFIFQSVALISQMSAYENVEFALRIAGVPRSERKDRANECLAFVGLQKRMHHRPAEMSGGEQQRVAIARAIAHHPSIIFADEPTAELDSLTGLQVVKMLKDLVAQEKVTIIMTTHDPSMMELGDDVYTLEDGQVVEEKHITALPQEVLTL